MLTAVFAVILQQTAPAVVWTEPAPPEQAAQAAATPTIPDWARADPFGYERSECSPLIRRASETLDACQARVRVALAANLGAALPSSLAPVGAPDTCRQEAAGDRYALQCGSPSRPDRPVKAMTEQSCRSRPRTTEGGVIWEDTCATADGSPTGRTTVLRLDMGDRP